MTIVAQAGQAREPAEVEPEEPREWASLLQVAKLVNLGRAELADDFTSAYFPPTDPVVIGEKVVGGFSATSMDGHLVEPSTLDGLPGDEALADAVRDELRGDASTSGLDVDVTVEDGVAFLRGVVSDIEDVENVEEVASRVPLAEVVEELDVTSAG